jgi:hypothetical protein
VAASQDRSPDRQAVVTVLRMHGLSGNAIAQLWKLSADMRPRTRRRGLEYAATVNLETGITVGSILSGSEDAIDLRRHIAAFVRGRQYVQLHTHPGSTPFSDADVQVLLSWEQIRVMGVVGVDGAWYALSRLRHPTASGRDAANAFLIELDLLAAEHLEMPLRERTHRVRLTIAERLGLRYDRIQGSEI